MKIIFNKILIETDEIQLITPLVVQQLFRKEKIDRWNHNWVTDGVLQYFQIFLLNKPELLQMEFPSETTKEEAETAYQKLIDIWKDKQDKFLTII